MLQRLVTLVDHGPDDPSTCATGADSVFKHICEAITIVCRDQKDAKKVLLEHGGIEPIVRLLRSLDAKVQRAASSVLRTLAFKEDQAKHAIIESGAIQPLIRMLRSEVRPRCRLLLGVKSSIHLQTAIFTGSYLYRAIVCCTCLPCMMDHRCPRRFPSLQSHVK